MADNGKRKNAPAGAAAEQRSKKKRTGNAGKWKTPHQQAKMALHQDAGVQPGDTGIWVTCARHQEGKAAREVGVLFAEYAEKMYGIQSVHDAHAAGDADGGDDNDAEAEDLEAAIQAEVAALTAKPSDAAGAGATQMKPVKMNVDCLLFVKTLPAVEPVAFVRRICEDAKACNEQPGLMRCRYVNRLTPVSVMGRATEQGLVEVSTEVLGPWFDLSGKRGRPLGAAVDGGDGTSAAEGAADAETVAGNVTSGDKVPDDERKPFTFAIRPTIRNHSNLKRDVVINTIAGLINDDRHKVNLGSPDKVILVDIFQTVCGMSVVDGDWDALKRFNLTELYSQARSAQGGEDSNRD